MVKCYVSMDDEVDALTDDEDKSLTLKYNGYERLESTGILKIKLTIYSMISFLFLSTLPQETFLRENAPRFFFNNNIKGEKI